MRYIFTIIATIFLSSVIYLTAAIYLTPAPIRAEYWVREMMVIKMHIVSQYGNKRKIIIVGGSSTLFGIDTQLLSNDLKLPVINFGLHAGLPLRVILNEAKYAANDGDVIILPLEPNYYNGMIKPTSWIARNTIAWDNLYWNQLDIVDKIKYISTIYVEHFPEPVIIELLQARVYKKYFPYKIPERLLALNDNKILQKFVEIKRAKIKILKFVYSAYNIDLLGNMRGNDGQQPFPITTSPERSIILAPENYDMLNSFVKLMNQKGVRIYFANTPYIANKNLNMKLVLKTNFQFKNAISHFSCVIDDKNQLIFPLKMFFNSDLHLNSEGRKLRTIVLENSIRNTILKGNTTVPKCNRQLLFNN